MTVMTADINDGQTKVSCVGQDLSLCCWRTSPDDTEPSPLAQWPTSGAWAGSGPAPSNPQAPLNLDHVADEQDPGKKTVCFAFGTFRHRSVQHPTCGNNPNR